jgi:hypothetical protein
LSWTARVRDASGGLGDPLEFTRVDLVENYGVADPDILIVEGDLRGVASALKAGTGIVVTDSKGRQRFSGDLFSLSKGARSAQIIYRGDKEHLMERRCWPTPAAPWEFQTSAYDVQTAPTETRILGYINRNAGPLAWKEVPTGSDPGTAATFDPYLVLTPTTKVNPQACGVDPDTGDIYVTQAKADADEDTPDDVYITRFVNGVQVSQMFIKGGGHGDQVIVSRVSGRVHISFRFRGQSGSHDVSGTWVRIPWTGGKSWTATQVLVYKIGTGSQPLYAPGKISNTAVPWRTNPDRRGWWQGEAQYGSTFYRMYGTPYDNTGPTGSNPVMPGILEVIQNNTIVRTVDASSLGRDTGGLPFNGRLEPEGLTVTTRNGQPVLMIGVVTGSGATLAYRLYTWAIKPVASTNQDRRVPRLRVPASLGRGDTGKTSARFQVLGELVAGLAELDDLRVNIVQTYEGTASYLDVQVSPAPDLTDSVQIGGPGDSGDLVLGEGWSYSITRPTGTTFLSAAGGQGVERLLSSLTDDSAERTWARRVEQFVDQRDTTEAAEIATGLKEALAEGVATTELSVPVEVVGDVGLGTDIPLGAKVTAVIDGELVVERIRQITTQLGGDGETEQVTAVLGTPDAGIPISTRRITNALKRVRRLERTEDYGSGVIDGGTF